MCLLRDGEDKGSSFLNMTERYNRRRVLKALGAVSATAALPLAVKAQRKGLRVTGRDVEIQITTVSPHTLWLHYPDDLKAVACEDEYLWARDLLVAPVVEKNATSRRVYLPRGTWYDFWTQEQIDGGHEITREVDLATIPLYVRAGAVLPVGPVKQHTAEQSDQPPWLFIYPGQDGAFLLYDDDGKCFDHRKGEWMGIQISWEDSRRVLKLRLAERSKMLSPLNRKIEVKLNEITRQVSFTGKPLEVQP